MKQGNYIRYGSLLVLILKINGNKLLVGFNEASTGVYKERWLTI